MRAHYSGVVRVFLMTWLAVGGPVAAADDLGLVDAARAQDSSSVRALLGRDADVNARSDDGSTALLWAAHWNDVATADLLIRARRQCQRANDFGMTPLSRACTNGSAALVELLLEAGADPNTRDCHGRDADHDVREQRQRRRGSALIARGADVNAREPSQNQTALMWAAAERHADVVRLLIEAGANLAGPDEERIHRAALRGARRRSGDNAAVACGRCEREHSVAAGEPAAETRRDNTGGGRSSSGAAAVGVAARGPAYQATLSAGSTPLLVATVRGHVPLALFLLEQGADPNVDRCGLHARCIGRQARGKAASRTRSTVSSIR